MDVRRTQKSKDVANDSKFGQLVPFIEMETQRKVKVWKREEILSIPLWTC